VAAYPTHRRVKPTIEQSCKHTSFSSEQANVAGINTKIGIVRCTQCGTAIGVLYPQVPDAFNALCEKLDVLQKAIQNLQH